jgi:hypothetical protein
MRAREAMETGVVVAVAALAVVVSVAFAADLLLVDVDHVTTFDAVAFVARFDLAGAEL